MKFLEYRPPKPKAAGKPKGSATKTSAGGGVGGGIGASIGASATRPPDPNQAKKDYIDELNEEIDGLG